MSKKTMTEKFIKTMNSWTDEECLTAFGTFLERVGVTSQFIQNDEGLLTHQVLITVCGDKVMTSEPQQLDWPLQELPMPESLKARMH